MRPDSCPLWRSGAWRRPGLLRYLGPRGQPGLPLREHAGGVASSLHPLLGRGFPPWVGGSHPRFLRLCAEVLGGSQSSRLSRGPGASLQGAGKALGREGTPGAENSPPSAQCRREAAPLHVLALRFQLKSHFGGNPMGQGLSGSEFRGSPLAGLGVPPSPCCPAAARAQPGRGRWC